jgi:hypothetical protein
LINSYCLLGSLDCTYKLSMHHWWHIGVIIIQLHLQVWATDVDSATHLADLILSTPWLKGILSHLTHYDAFYILYIFLIIFQWSMHVILIYAKMSWLWILSQGESYLSILKLLTAKALETYSIWSISHSFMRSCLFLI